VGHGAVALGLGWCRLPILERGFDGRSRCLNVDLASEQCLPYGPTGQQEGRSRGRRALRLRLSEPGEDDVEAGGEAPHGEGVDAVVGCFLAEGGEPAAGRSVVPPVLAASGGQARENSDARRTSSSEGRTRV
jgi:hypothetical protein